MFLNLLGPISLPALALACVLANLSTERAAPRIPAAIGWPLTALLVVCAIAALCRDLSLPVAISVASLYLMAGIAVVSALLGYRNRSRRPSARNRHES